MRRDEAMKESNHVIYINQRYLRHKRRERRYQDIKDFLLGLSLAGALYVLFLGAMYSIPWGFTW